MIEWIALAKTIAEVLGIGAGVITAGNEILKLVNHHKATGNQKASRIGYVYVVQEVEYSKRCRIGRIADNADWLSELGMQIPGTLEPILVVPTDDTWVLERELHKLCGTNRNVGDWFDLTPAQVTQLRQLQVVVDLAAGNLISPREELDPDALEQAKRLFELLSNASSVTVFHQKANSRSDSSANLDLKSVPTVDYHGLPKLKRQSGYLLVIRDVENSVYRIESTDYPVQYIGEALGLVNPHFGLELVLAFRSNRVSHLEENLSILYPSDHENRWRALSTPQLQEIRNLAKPGIVQKSVFVKPKTHWGLETVQVNDYKELPRLRYPDGYVCITQGVKPGKKYKIWHTTKPKELAEDLRFALMLNNPYDATTSSEPIRFACVIKTKHATSFKDFLHKRYSELRQGGDWFDLDKTQLNEIKDMASHH